MTGVCRVCRCTDTTPCPVDVEQADGTMVVTPCWWVEPDLCSGCDVAGDVHPDEPLLYDHLGRPIDFGGDS